MAHGGNPWALMEGPVLDFSVDLNPLGPPEGWREIAAGAAEQALRYPEPTYRAFCEAAARAERVKPEWILPGNGTAELIHLVSRWKARTSAVVAAPAFTEYERAVQADGSRLHLWFFQEEKEFAPAALEDFPAQGSGGLLFLCNPNNPTGGLWSPERLKELILRCDQQGRTVVLDEAYLDLAQDPVRCSAVPWTQQFPHLIVLRSMTKSFALPGVRIGYGVAHPETVAELRQIQPPWMMNGLAAELGCWLFEQREHLPHSRRALSRLRDRMERDLASIPGLRPFPSEANFFLCRLTDLSWTGLALAQALARQGLIIRVCDDFSGLDPERFIRIAVRTEEENGKLLAALKELLR